MFLAHNGGVKIRGGCDVRMYDFKGTIAVIKLGAGNRQEKYAKDDINFEVLGILRYLKLLHMPEIKLRTSCASRFFCAMNTVGIHTQEKYSILK